MKIHRLTIEEAFGSLKSGSAALALDEAQRRLAEYGRNEVERIQREPFVLRFVKEFGHLFAIILWIAAALAFVSEYQQPGEGMATLGLAIVGVIVVNGLFSFFSDVSRREGNRGSPKAVAARDEGRAGRRVALPARRGTRTRRSNRTSRGDKVPADCRVIEAFGVRVNNATMITRGSPTAAPCEGPDWRDAFHTALGNLRGIENLGGG